MPKVIKDASGTVINVGDWDYDYVAEERAEEQPVLEDGKPVLDENKNPLTRIVSVLTGVKTARNPLPEGAYEAEIELVVGADGGKYDPADYRRLRKMEYPSIGDQLDALWKGGEEADAMRASVAAIKKRYPARGAKP